jgi:hypothetical protein
MWLDDENNGQEVLIDHLTVCLCTVLMEQQKRVGYVGYVDPHDNDNLQQTFEESEAAKDDEDVEADEADQLTQLIHTFCQGAIVESREQEEDDLYMSYADIMARSCGEEDEEGGDDDEGEQPSLQEQEIDKMRLLFNQGRLATRCNILYVVVSSSFSLSFTLSFSSPLNPVFINFLLFPHFLNYFLPPHLFPFYLSLFPFYLSPFPFPLLSLFPLSQSFPYGKICIGNVCHWELSPVGSICFGNIRFGICHVVYVGGG